LNVSVTTKAGQVTLGGSVLSAAEKQLAIETARNIRGVQAVEAAGLSIAG
jgi:osmotically-inducible protein OsmY